jgi:hypothetical protein
MNVMVWPPETILKVDMVIFPHDASREGNYDSGTLTIKER